MRHKRLFVYLALLALVCISCKKDRFDLDNLQGVKAEGEMLLPVASASFTVMELMQQFDLDSVISCSEDGNLSYAFRYEDFGVLKGEDLLKFRDLQHTTRFIYTNPFPFVLPQAIDTVFRLEQKIAFESNNIHVMEAQMKSGHFDFNVKSNIGLLQRVVLRSPNLKDANGHELTLDFDLTSSEIQFDLDGLQYVTDSANSLVLSYDVYVKLQGSSDSELYFDVEVLGSDLALKEMMGTVDPYMTRSCIDTMVVLFPGNVSGALEVFGARLKISERNTFNLDARLDVDTAWIITDGEPPFPIFGPEPVKLEIPSQNEMGQVFERTLNGKISANETGIYAANTFIVNPLGHENLVSVADDCVIDVIFDTEIPFVFKVDDVCYSDTTELELSEIKTPEQIEKLTLELTITSTLPIDMNAQFFAYDSETGQITDTLVAEDRLIKASFDGQPETTEVTLEITGDKVESLIHSDRLISLYELDTEEKTAVLKADQSLKAFVKAKVKYNGIVELKNE